MAALAQSSPIAAGFAGVRWLSPGGSLPGTSSPRAGQTFGGDLQQDGADIAQGSSPSNTRYGGEGTVQYLCGSATRTPSKASF
eukprot:3493788-Pyramimonas_sp.AAC.1